MSKPTICKNCQHHVKEIVSDNPRDHICCIETIADFVLGITKTVERSCYQYNTGDCPDYKELEGSS